MKFGMLIFGYMNSKTYYRKISMIGYVKYVLLLVTLRVVSATGIKIKTKYLIEADL